ncbi:hypothetical protein [Streptomyces sp. NPDC096152]|uniref:hypothetical protein n=1 Tax=Streptomyces sp. NPDC096152 TaxID=3366078 RepID=UPI0038205D8E
MTCESDSRFAQVLGDLVPVLDAWQLIAFDIVDAADELVGAVASAARAGAA